MTPEWERLLERRRNARLWADAACEIGATHAFTFNPNCGFRFKPDYKLEDHGFDDHRARVLAFISGYARKLYKELNRHLRGFTHRQNRFHHADSINFVGAYELLDKHRQFYPHAHLAIALRPGEDIKLHQFMVQRWGGYERCGVTGREAYYPAFDRPIVNEPHCKPEYHLGLITGTDGWMTYVAKQSDEFTLPALPGEFLKPSPLQEA
jgi:hypothetical protein